MKGYKSLFVNASMFSRDLIIIAQIIGCVFLSGVMEKPRFPFSTCGTPTDSAQPSQTKTETLSRAPLWKRLSIVRCRYRNERRNWNEIYYDIADYYCILGLWLSLIHPLWIQFITKLCRMVCCNERSTISTIQFRVEGDESKKQR